MKNSTFGAVLKANRGIGAGFDTLRVTLSFGVILWHSYALCYGSIVPVKDTFFWSAGYSILPIFFALSGFLVTGSAARLSLAKFAASRVLRIVPALVVDTLVTILIIGPVFTTLALSAYFTHPTTAKYFLNMVGEIHFYLPGVFEDNPYPRVVNGSLWTIPPELACYIVMAMLMATGLVKKASIVFLAAAALFGAILVAYALPDSLNIPGKGFAQSGGMKLVPMFLLGALAFLLADRIPRSAPIAASCAGVVFAAGFLLNGNEAFNNPFWVIGTAPLLVYLMAYLGTANLPKLPFFHRGDYSYGIYLYGFPIQQSLVNLTDVRNPLILFLATAPIVTLLAIFSWHVVEKPTLRLRKGFSFATKVQQEREKSDADAPVLQRPAVNVSE